MAQAPLADEQTGLTPWDPQAGLGKRELAEAKLSRGFLRSRPEKWFPGFPTHWLPLAHSLGVEFKTLEVKPFLSAPKQLDHNFIGTVDHEPIAIMFDAASARFMLDAVCPGAGDNARDVVLEYLARRFMVSLAMSWSGAEASVVQYEPDLTPSQVKPGGAVKFTASVNNAHFTIWLLLGRGLVDRLDGLWRRQVQSTSKPLDGRMNESGNTEIQLEIAQLAVPPSMLVDYIKSGTVVDLEVLAGDSLVLRQGPRVWLPGRLIMIENNLGVEVLSGPPPNPTLPEGTTRLSIQFDPISLDASSMAELSQPGALWDTGHRVGNQVRLVVNSETVAQATLCSYEGRFAVSVR